ncbi:hypothetical protein [Bacillus subtilis]
MPGVAHFNDNIRDGLKGSVFIDTDNGFINGKDGLENRIKTGIVGEIDYNADIKGFTKQPTQAITYVEAHDNHTLWDKLELTNPETSEADRTKMHRLASSILVRLRTVELDVFLDVFRVRHAKARVGFTHLD